MDKKQKLKYCNWTLLVLMLVTLASSIQLEVSGSRNNLFVWLHVIIAFLFLGFVFYHIKLHFGWKNWFLKFRKLKSQVTRILWWVCILTVLSAIAAFIHWVLTFEHSPIGGIHGKIGFIMVLLCICHVIKRIGFYKR